MTEISLPTKVTQDSIKIETDKIQLIRNDTQYIRGQFPISGGTDWSEYSGPYVINSEVQITSDIYRTALNISGKGALLYADANGTNFSIRYSGIVRITVDGVVTFHGRTGQANSSFVGVRLGESDLGLPYPYINTSNPISGYVELYKPILFKKSLKIETTISGINSPQACRIKYLLKK